MFIYYPFLQCYKPSFSSCKEEGLDKIVYVTLMAVAEHVVSVHQFGSRTSAQFHAWVSQQQGSVSFLCSVL